MIWIADHEVRMQSTAKSSESVSIYVVYMAGIETCDRKSMSYLVSVMKYCVLIEVVKDYVSLPLQQVSGVAIGIIFNSFLNLLGIFVGEKPWW